MFILKSTHEKEVFWLKKKAEQLQSELATLKADKELESEQNLGLFNKLQANKKQIEGLLAELNKEERIKNKVSRGGFSRLRKSDLLDELEIAYFQVENLNELIDKLQLKIVDLESSPEQKLSEEAEVLLKKTEELNDNLKFIEEEIKIKEEELEEKEKAALAKIKPNKAMLKEFKKTVKNLPENAKGVCIVKEKGKTKKVEIESKNHAEEIIRKCENGELEFVG